MKKLIIITILSLLACSSLAFASPTSTAQRMCIKDANQDYRDAVKAATLDLRTQINTCRFGATVAGCMNGCFQTFKDCINPVEASLKSCRTGCGTKLLQDRDAARQAAGCGNSCRENATFQKAIIQANIAFYTCRLTCRSEDASLTARAQCRATLATCLNTCKSSS